MKNQLAEQIQHHIESNKLYEAKALLDQDRAKLEIDNFRYLYLTAKLEIYSGNYLTAAKILSNATCQFHLEALADLCLCYFQLGLMDKFMEALEKLHSSYKQQKNTLTERELINTAIILSKFYEEVGQADLALELLSLTVHEAYSAKTLAIQKLRLLVTMGKTREARTLYKVILLGTQHDQNFEIEREHALLLADNHLFGTDSALERYRYITSLNLSPADRSFLFFEIAECLIVSGEVHKLLSLEQIQTAHNEFESHFSTLIKKYLLNEDLPSPQLNQFEKSLTPTSLVRLIRIFLILSQQPTLPSEQISAATVSSKNNSIEPRFQFHLANLQSKCLREQLGKLPTEKNENVLHIDFLNKCLEFKNVEYKFKNRMFWKIGETLKKLTLQNEIALSEAIFLIYEEAETPQHYDRLRMAIYRLNKELSLTLGCSEVFYISKKGIGTLLSIQWR